MRLRNLLWVVGFVLALVVLVGVVLEVLFACPQGTGAAAGGSTMLTSQPKEPDPSKGSEKAGTAFDQQKTPGKTMVFLGCLGQRIAALPLNLLRVIAEVGGIFLVVFLGYRLYRLLSAPPQLVVEDPGNASGAKELDGILSGLGQSLREFLVPELRKARHEWDRNLRVEEGRAVRPDAGHAVVKAPTRGLIRREKVSVTRDKIDETLKNLLDSLSKDAPKEVSMALRLLNLLVGPPRGTRVIGSLRRLGDAPDRVGIVLQIADLRDEQERSIRTVWESVDPSVRAVGGNPNAPALPGGTDPDGALEKGLGPSQAGTADQAPAGDEEARALYALGSVYEESGALGRAKALYEQALQKKPAYDEARQALGRVLGRDGSLAGRYEVLLSPCARWLAYEIHRREVERDYGRDLTEEERAELHNFYGVLYQASAPAFSQEHAGFFHDLAIGEFRRAVEIRAGWYRPHENLADTYSSRERESKDMQLRSVVEYDNALSCVERNIEDELERRLVRLRIEAARATSMVLTGEEELVREAADQVRRMEDEIQVVADKVFSAQARSTAAREDHGKGGKNASGYAYLLYNVACFYAVAHKKNAARFPEAKSKAQRYLAYSLARDDSRNLWNWAGKDEDLNSIHDGFYERLTTELLKARRKQSGIPILPEPALRSEIERLLEKIAPSPEDS